MHYTSCHQYDPILSCPHCGSAFSLQEKADPQCETWAQGHHGIGTFMTWAIWGCGDREKGALLVPQCEDFRTRVVNQPKTEKRASGNIRRRKSLIQYGKRTLTRQEGRES